MRGTAIAVLAGVYLCACGSDKASTASGAPATTWEVALQEPAPDSDAIVARVNGAPVFASCVKTQAEGHALSASDALQECIGFELLAQAAAEEGHQKNSDVQYVAKRELARRFVLDMYQVRSPADLPLDLVKKLWDRVQARRYNYPELRDIVFCRVPLTPAQGPGSPEYEAGMAFLTSVYQELQLRQGLEQDELFICMEYLRGVSALTFLKSHSVNACVPVGLAVSIIRQAAAGLHFAHEVKGDQGEPLGIVHRDISPGNIFITAGGVAKVLDFGIVKANDSAHKTTAGIIKGKLSYMSPEQLMALPLDRRSDIFSLAIVLYELLTNRRLFKRKSDFETIKAITEMPIPRLLDANPALPVELDEVLTKALQRDREDRYPSMREFARALGRALRFHGGCAESADVEDYVKMRFAQQLAEIDAMLRSVCHQPPPTPASEAKTRCERTSDIILLKEASTRSLDTPEEFRTDSNREHRLACDSSAGEQGEDAPSSDCGSIEVSATEDVLPLPKPQRATETSSLRPLIWIGCAILACVIGGLVVLLLRKQRPPAERAATIVYSGANAPEQSRALSVAEAARLPQSVDAGATGTAIQEGLLRDAGPTPRVPSPVTVSKRRPHRCEAKRSAGERNSCYVASKRKKLTKCLRENASSISGAPEIALRFELDARGTIEEVNVVPSAIASTVLGRCIARVAQEIRFGPQEGKVHFRIPLGISGRGL